MVLRLISYQFKIWANAACLIETGILEDLFCEINMCFDINSLSSNITHIVLISWPLSEIYGFIDYIINYFSAVMM